MWERRVVSRRSTFARKCFRILLFLADANAASERRNAQISINKRPIIIFGIRGRFADDGAQAEVETRVNESSTRVRKAKTWNARLTLFMGETRTPRVAPYWFSRPDRAGETRLGRNCARRTVGGFERRERGFSEVREEHKEIESSARAVARSLRFLGKNESLGF